MTAMVALNLFRSAYHSSTGAQHLRWILHLFYNSTIGRNELFRLIAVIHLTPNDMITKLVSFFFKSLIILGLTIGLL